LEKESLEPLRAVASRFPDRPSVYAHILRLACIRELRVGRKEEDLLNAEPWLIAVGFGASSLARIGATPRAVLFVSLLGLPVMGVMAWSILHWVDAISEYSAVFAELTNAPIISILSLPNLAKIFTIAACVVVPGLYVIVLAVVAMARDRLNPRSLATVSATLVFLIGAVYAIVAFSTVRREDKLGEELDKVLIHEGRFYAQRQGRQWPGLVK